MTSPMIKPGQTIGILGGGQLGRMSAMAAKHMGYRVVTLATQTGSPCGQVVDQEIVGDLEDSAAVKKVAQESDVVTYEFENVGADPIDRLERDVPVHPSAQVLRTAQNRLVEKDKLADLGLPTAPFRAVGSQAELETALTQIGYPAVLKTATGGYDGKGQRIIDAPDSVHDSYADLAAVTRELILEAFVGFDKEISVIVARNVRGETACFPVFENIHHNNILHMTIAPARISNDLARRAQALAESIVDGLDVIGLIAVEMFVAGQDLFINELAPRPHNSGHLSLDACTTSQFEQHVRAVCNLPLGRTDLNGPAVMVNVLGQHLTPLLASLEAVLGTGSVKVHIYGKAKARENRKMGHITVQAATVEEALERADDIAAQIGAGSNRKP